MTLNIASCWIGTLCLSLIATRVLGADGERFSDEAETTIGVFVGNEERTAKLRMGRTEVVEVSGAHRAFDVATIYMSGSKLLWWALLFPSPSKSAHPIQAFKRFYRCAATSDAIVCFAAADSVILARRSGEKVEAPEISAFVNKRIVDLGTEAIGTTLMKSFQRITLDNLTRLAPLYARSLGEIGGPVPFFQVTRIRSLQTGWEVNIRNSINGRVGAVRLDTEMRPVSGTMVKEK
jgi:hypothetical protein